MPELPEVETTRRGIAPFLIGQAVRELRIRQARLRWPIARQLREKWPGQVILAVERRAKYLLAHTEVGSALLHLGMSGSLRILPASAAHGPHDHVDVLLESGKLLRYTDPRRFGCLLWQRLGEIHPLLAKLGPEPLAEDFDGDYLWRQSRGRSVAIKNFLMDQRIVVGVGNIYAAEALFEAGIHPGRAAGKVSRQRYVALAEAVRTILAQAIARGGTTLRDFLQPDGEPGYFEQELRVYGRGGEACRQCGGVVRSLRLGQRASCYCPRCQR